MKSKEKKQILHYRLDGFRDVYLCNQAVMVTPSKIAKVWKNVTCKNCLQIHKKELESESK